MLDPCDIDAIAAGVAELLRKDALGFPARGLVGVSDVCRLLRVQREWVYQHKSQLGAVRIGDGGRGPLRFDAARVLAYVESRRVDRRPQLREQRRPGRPRKHLGVAFDLLRIPDR